jgi:phosphoribosylformimino-5-aminoimidazole carboxamide ribotide isomerase
MNAITNSFLRIGIREIKIVSWGNFLIFKCRNQAFLIRKNWCIDMEIIPAISLFRGNVVKVAQGNFAEVKVYEEQALDIALKIEEAGFKRILLIDLDGVKKGVIVNYTTIEMISRYTGLQIDFSGGVTNDGDIQLAFGSGAHRIAAGRIATDQPDLLNQWIISYGSEKIILSADSKDGKITTGDWGNTLEYETVDFIRKFVDRGIKYVKCTDLSSHGQAKGPAVNLFKKLKEEIPEMSLMASGGVRSLSDLESLEELGVHSVVIGKALHEDLITLTDLQGYLIS